MAALCRTRSLLADFSGLLGEDGREVRLVRHVVRQWQATTGAPNEVQQLLETNLTQIVGDSYRWAQRLARSCRHYGEQ